MLFRNQFDSLKRGLQRRRPVPCRLGVEALDDRLLPSTLSVGSAVVAEGDAGTTAAAVVVSLDAPSNKTVTVGYGTQDGTATAAGRDYVATSGTLTFAPGQTSKTISVPVIGDRIAEPDETFSVKLHGAKNATIANGQGVVTILDDEPRISISGAAGAEGNTGTTPFTFTVSLSAAYDQAVTVNYSTADGTAVAGVDYGATSGALTFAPGETTKTIAVGVIGNTTPQSDRTFFANLGGASAYALIVNGQAVGRIQDDEPRISIGGAYANAWDETVTFTVRLSAAYDQAVTVNFATQDGTALAGVNYYATSGTLTFAPGETTKTITVAILPNYSPTQETYFLLTLSGASANALIVQSPAVGTLFGPPEPFYGDPYGGI
jgi:large repetitive protein